MIDEGIYYSVYGNYYCPSGSCDLFVSCQSLVRVKLYPHFLACPQHTLTYDARKGWSVCGRVRHPVLTGTSTGRRAIAYSTHLWDGITLLIVMSDPKRMHGKQSIPIDFEGL